jgi:isopenicillin N synthase-like dioxygenase
LIEQVKTLFALPVEEKMRHYIGKSSNHRGYVPEGEEVFAGGSKDRKEAYDLGFELASTDPDVMAGTPMLGPNVWPDIEGFREDVGAYYRATFELGRTLFRGFALALGLEESFFDKFITKPPSQLRLLHYPFSPDATDVAGIGAHTDYECFTILLPTAPGLEVMNARGEWIDAPPVKDAFIVNIGDLLEVWTNGEFVATSHRVRKVKEERYSFPLFFACDYHTTVAPLPAFVPEGSAPKYQPLSAGDHLFAQTAQSFSYLKRRLAAGDLSLPENAHGLSSFGQEARYQPMR